ncbi:hypothetical protein B0H19DRAFT_1243471 [Mycena capillaripes]|nr:hypothetical protein B0H19DRAFT_1243471 [Mycena capillaripes]
MRDAYPFLALALGFQALACAPFRPSRGFILSDIFSESEDAESLVRYLLYANQFNIVGLVAPPSTGQPVPSWRCSDVRCFLKVDSIFTSWSNLNPFHMVNELPVDDDSLLFSSLPTELLCAIVRVLDPIGLISLSQSSRAFRALIQPSQEDFIQRLLALELDPHLGGIVRFRSSDNNLTPPWDDAEAWKTIRFACVGCMKLLPHTRFSNQNLLQLRRRKPPPGSREADRITNWEPLAGGDAKARGLRIQERARREKEDRAAVRFELERSTEAGAGADELDACSEAVLGGVHRIRRRCNECRFQRGDFTRPTRVNAGTVAVPILKSRRLEFPSALERYFPGLLPQMPLEMTPLLFRIWNDEVRTELFTLYHVRCPGCAVWQELGAFRVGLPYAHATPRLMLEERRRQLLGGEDVFDTLLCNRCVLAQHGHARLGEELTAFATMLVDGVHERAEYQLRFGWRLLEETLRFPRRKKNRYPFSAGFREIIAGLPWVAAKNMGHKQKTLEFHRCDPDDLRRRIVRLRVLVETELTGEKRTEFLSNSWFRWWLEDYEKNERLVAMLEEVRSVNGPDVLVDFVLEKYPYRVI